MPVIAIVDAVKILVYYDDHPPPHVHAEFAGHLAQYEIGSGRLLKGSLPPARHRAVANWLDRRQADVLEAWENASQHRKPRRIS